VTFNSGTDLGVDVQLTASNVSLNGTAINTQTNGAEPGGNITVTADRVTLDQGARIVTGSEGEGAAGAVIIQGPEEAEGVATRVGLSVFSLIGSSLAGSGAGGEIAITAKSLDLDVGSSIVSSTNGSASNGAIVVSVHDATLTGGSTIASDTAFAGEGVVGGKITVQGLDGGVSKAASLILKGSRSGLTAATFGTGKLGDIEVHAETLRMTDGAVIEAGTPLDTASAGTITIVAGEVDISDESRILSHAFNLDAGPVNITADQFSLDKSTIETDTSSGTSGLGGNVILNVASASLTNGATINSSASNTGFAGNISILASGSVTMTNGSTITASTSGTGDAGQVIVTTPTVSLNDANITTSTSGTGNAGSIAITTTGNSLSLANGSTISSTSTEKAAVPNPDGLTTEPPGTAGNVTITATGSFASDASSIATSAEANHGGDISITAESVQLSNGTKIDASSNAPLEVTKLVLEIDENGNPVLDENGQPKLVTVLVGDGNAGNVTIISDSNVVMQNSSVTTEASQASGGSIEINASDTGMIQLVNSKVSTSVKGVGGGSDGGNISIDPQFVILQNSQLVAQANAGAGGAINVIAKVFIADPNSLVSASSQSGPQGTVNIQSPVQNIGGELAALSQEFSSAAALMAQQCAARAADGKFSTFVVAAREGLPVEPGGFLASPSLTSELLGSRLSGGQASHSQLSAFTGLFPKYDATPIQLAKLGNACR
jgi:large exoprotein involved in heme utilization and adhesion